MPGTIRDLATQLVTARDLYSGVLHLRAPLEQPRYALARGIEVSVRRLAHNSGVAYDEVSRPAADAPSSACALTIAVSNALSFDRNPTAAHELFHLYQYGYAMFKRRGYLEGMARWMERAFVVPRTRQGGAAPAQGCAESLAAGYAAAAYWEAQFGQAGLALPPVLRARHYRDGRPVMAVTSLTGAASVRPVLTALAALSDRIADSAGLPRYAFPEAVQTSPRFDAMMCDAVDRAAARP